MPPLSYLGNADIGAIESLYLAYVKDPASVSDDWRCFFDGFSLSKETRESGTGLLAAAEETGAQKALNVLNLINAYRMRGHLFAKTNPVRDRQVHKPPLELSGFSLSDADLDTVFQAGTVLGLGPTTLRNILAHLEATYCRSIGAEFKYVHDPATVHWLQFKMEPVKNTPQFTVEHKRHMLHKLTQAVTFEHFLHSHFVGQKRFSLEGCEALIPAFDSAVSKGAALGIQEFVIGMAHRGRLNVLAHIMGKAYEEIFTEFAGAGYGDSAFGGDVKYHMGFSNDLTLEDGRKVHLSLCPNPSHLESVDPVVQGAVRAKLDFSYNGDQGSICPIVIHGEASLAGQGVVYEVIQMSLLEGYKTGGTIHLVINNQVGFTTDFWHGRSSTYCTDVAKVTRSPVFHVNADDVESLVYTIQLAMEYRQKFHRDVFIDIHGYRRHGHNEGDEPRFTQPELYGRIAKHDNVLKVYQQQLMDEGSLSADDVAQVKGTVQAALQEAHDRASQQTEGPKETSYFGRYWSGLTLPPKDAMVHSPETGVDATVLRPLSEQMLEIPAEIHCLRKVRKIFDDRKRMLNETDALDWAMGEWLAYASLLAEVIDIRLSGQDSERGTFSHRHAVITSDENTEPYVPLNHMKRHQGTFHIYNSPLSEYGVLGFELGYAMANPHRLVIWEAQFGDFINGGQIVIDQYLSCAETKWQRMNGLVLLLPHGFEGQGPEHSSARVERFLELCANDNMQVANCSTPANFFHIVRRQIHRTFRRPLVVLTPKSLLRHPRCVSRFEDFTRGGFREIIDDAQAVTKSVKKVVLCSGKLFYDLDEQREARGRQDVALIRLEQLYPLSMEQLAQLRKKYKKAKRWVWAQEEPENMGAWPFILRKLRDYELECVARRENATPATGFTKTHLEQQANIINAIFD